MQGKTHNLSRLRTSAANLRSPRAVTLPPAPTQRARQVFAMPNELPGRPAPKLSRSSRSFFTSQRLNAAAREFLFRQWEVSRWIEKVLGMKLKTDDISVSLHDGTLLCDLLHVFANKKTGERFNAEKYSKFVRNPNNEWGKRSNLELFLIGCREALHIREVHLFVVSDLFELKNLIRVVDTLRALARQGEQYGLPAIPNADRSNEEVYFTKHAVAVAAAHLESLGVEATAHLLPAKDRRGRGKAPKLDAVVEEEQGNGEKEKVLSPSKRPPAPAEPASETPDDKSARILRPSTAPGEAAGTPSTEAEGDEADSAARDSDDDEVWSEIENRAERTSAEHKVLRPSMDAPRPENSEDQESSTGDDIGQAVHEHTSAPAGMDSTEQGEKIDSRADEDSETLQGSNGDTESSQDGNDVAAQAEEGDTQSAHDEHGEEYDVDDDIRPPSAAAQAAAKGEAYGSKSEAEVLLSLSYQDAFEAGMMLEVEHKFEECGVLRVKGLDSSGRVVVLLNASRLPYDNARSMNAFLFYAVKTLHAVVEREYVLIYISRLKRMPSLKWLRAAYRLFNRKFKKNLKRLYIIDPSMSMKTLLFVLQPLLSRKFYKNKLVYLPDAEDLALTLGITDELTPSPPSAPTDQAAETAEAMKNTLQFAEQRAAAEANRETGIESGSTKDGGANATSG